MCTKALYWLILVGCLVGCHQQQGPTTPPQRYISMEKMTQITCQGARAICVKQLGGTYKNLGISIDCRGSKIAYNYDGLVKFQCNHPKKPFVLRKEGEPNKHQSTISMSCHGLRKTCAELTQLGETELVYEEADVVVKCTSDRIIIQPHQRRYGNQTICRPPQLALAPP